MPIAVAFPVESAAAERWLAGAEPPSDVDLLDSVAERTGVVYCARMHSFHDWPRLALLAELHNPHKLLFRTATPGLLAIIQHYGGKIALWESSGKARCFLEGKGLDRFRFHLALAARRWGIQISPIDSPKLAVKLCACTLS